MRDAESLPEDFIENLHKQIGINVKEERGSSLESPQRSKNFNAEELNPSKQDTTKSLDVLPNFRNIGGVQGPKVSFGEED